MVCFGDKSPRKDGKGQNCKNKTSQQRQKYDAIFTISQNLAKIKEKTSLAQNGKAVCHSKKCYNPAF